MNNEHPQGESQEHLYPSLLKRIQSLFFDTIILILASIFMSLVLDWLDMNPSEGVRKSIFVICVVLYEPLCVAYGATLGNHMMAIRVRSVNNTHKRIGLLASFLRFGVKIMLGWLSFLTIGSNPQKRAIHDIVSGSVVLNHFP